MDELISSFFGDHSIYLTCPRAGECMKSSQVPKPSVQQGIYTLILFTERISLVYNVIDDRWSRCVPWIYFFCGFKN